MTIRFPCQIQSSSYVSTKHIWNAHGSVILRWKTMNKEGNVDKVIGN